MNYPLKLEEHDISFFKETAVLNISQGQNTKAYTHFLHPYFRTLPMHSHNYYELNIITKGNGMHYIGNHIYPATVGNAYILPPNMRHGYYSDEDFSIFHLVISNLFLHTYSDELRPLDGYSFLFEIEPILRYDSNINALLKIDDSAYSYIENITNRLIYYDKEEVSNKIMLKNTLSLNLIAEMCTVAADINKEKTQNMSLSKDGYVYPITKAMMYISENYAKKISFNYVAELVGMSYPTFYRSFIKINKMPPAIFLKHYRVKKSLELLTYSDLSIAQIALDCGFYDSSHFIKSFTSIKNTSPNDYRRVTKKE